MTAGFPRDAGRLPGGSSHNGGARAAELAGLRFSLVGAGNVGQSVASWLVACGGTLAQVASRPGSARAAAFAGRMGVPAVDLAAFTSRNEALLLVAVPDGALAAVAATLAAQPQAAVALHVSGFAPAEELAALRDAGAALGGFHPLRAFPGVESAVERAAGLFFALDGDPAAVALGRRLAAAFGGSCAVVGPAERPLYHLAATLMAGAITTVASVATEIARRSELPPAVLPGLARLATEALAGALALADPAAGITGPAARGDAATFFVELDRLAETAPEAVPVVVALGRESLRQRARLDPPDRPRQALADRLASAELLDLTKDRVLTSKSRPSG